MCVNAAVSEEIRMVEYGCVGCMYRCVYSFVGG